MNLRISVYDICMLERAILRFSIVITIEQTNRGLGLTATPSDARHAWARMPSRVLAGKVPSAAVSVL